MFCFCCLSWSHLVKREEEKPFECFLYSTKLSPFVTDCPLDPSECTKQENPSDGNIHSESLILLAKNTHKLTWLSHSVLRAHSGSCLLLIVFFLFFPVLQMLFDPKEPQQEATYSAECVSGPSLWRVTVAGMTKPTMMWGVVKARRRWQPGPERPSTQGHSSLHGYPQNLRQDWARLFCLRFVQCHWSGTHEWNMTFNSSTGKYKQLVMCLASSTHQLTTDQLTVVRWMTFWLSLGTQGWSVQAWLLPDCFSVKAEPFVSYCLIVWLDPSGGESWCFLPGGVFLLCPLLIWKV